MSQPRNIEQELDQLHNELRELKQLVLSLHDSRSMPQIENRSAPHTYTVEQLSHSQQQHNSQESELHYAGRYASTEGTTVWTPQRRSIGQLLDLDSDKSAKIIGALGHKQRLDIMKAVLAKPMSGPELVELLQMGTTGQLYHHTKALTGADLLQQDERGGAYFVPAHRKLPLLLLLAAASDLLDTSDYLAMTELRSEASQYFNKSEENYDPHQLLYAVMENAVMEHKAGYCSRIDVFLQKDGTVTVSDNGRGIPVREYASSGKSIAQTVMTDMSADRLRPSASHTAPGAESGIDIPSVNAFSELLSLEIRRENRVYRQDYRYGIPQTGLLTIGTTDETGTSLTFRPIAELFRSTFDPAVVSQHAAALQAANPTLTIQVNVGQ
ncbi:DNA gyrase subunit B [Paenibacillus cellulosilyticus]|uniref:DNA topoisomerase (ATP-hydrolyzing) n=1 Tax=Paenibacillus cellulosilyticus TaxID=375489 RepID=A0A2V2YV42_9BACL|nr:ATP-binding protein [Paenibacillus cellulosilyticus]PWW00649.1 DNA gyrase subunit B [Paenibacillus cellulosilyticus]QKS45515.1 ArsR family transcriptional regulator [Paenibacillus cellulosilyticus]